MTRTTPPDGTTADLRGRRPFPEPAAVLSLRNARVFHTVDDDGQPTLVVTDGVTTVALESGLNGLSDVVVAASGRLAEAVDDYAMSVRAAWLRRHSPTR